MADLNGGHLVARTLREAVGGDAAPIVAARFGVTERGNFEDGETVLSVVRSIPELASDVHHVGMLAKLADMLANGGV